MTFDENVLYKDRAGVSSNDAEQVGVGVEL